MSIRVHNALAVFVCLTAGTATAFEFAPKHAPDVAGAVAAVTARPKAPAVLQLDDGTSENTIGDSGQFMWLNRFTPAAGDFPIRVDSVDVVFGDNNVTIGDPVEVFIYHDTDGDGSPATNAVLVASATGTVQANDQSTASTITLTTPPVLELAGDIIVGVVNRGGSDGFNDFPATLDQGASQGRSWAASWLAGDVPAAPTLPADEQWGMIDSFGFPGNWLVRANIETAAPLPDDDPPILVTNAGLTLDEGTQAALGAAVLQATDPDTDDDLLVYAITTAPANGQLELAGAPGTAISSFTQAQLNAAQVVYVHDDSETSSDGFMFDIQDGSGNDLNGQTFAITINPVDDQAPVLTVNAGVTVPEGGTAVIGASVLQATDADSSDPLLAFTVTTAPANGQLELAGMPGTVIASFTQADLDANLVRYVHDGSNTLSDSFGFSVDDGSGNVLAGQGFAITVTPLGDDAINIAPGSLVLAEGATGSFDVQLSTQPSGDVLLAVASAAPGIATAAPVQLTFSTANWNIPQTVTVQAVDDAIAGGDRSTQVSVAPAPGTLDPAYAALPPSMVAVTTLDDDAVGITVTPLVGLLTNENGSGDSLTVVLDSEPQADVLVALASSNPAEGSVTPLLLTFTAANWNVPQTVSVVGVDDSVDDGDQAWSVLFTVSSADPDYAGLALPAAGVVNADNDSAPVPAVGPVTIPASSDGVLGLLALLVACLGGLAARARSSQHG